MALTTTEFISVPSRNNEGFYVIKIKQKSRQGPAGVFPPERMVDLT